MRRIDHDVDPEVVARAAACRHASQKKTAAWGVPRRCATGICDGDGSCVACGAIQGEHCRPTTKNEP